MIKKLYQIKIINDLSLKLFIKKFIYCISRISLILLFLYKSKIIIS